jgi:hypothetical protein
MQYKKESTMANGGAWNGWVHIESRTINRFSLVVRAQPTTVLTVVARRKCQPTATDYTKRQSFTGEEVQNHVVSEVPSASWKPYELVLVDECASGAGIWFIRITCDSLDPCDFAITSYRMRSSRLVSRFAYVGSAAH